VNAFLAGAKWAEAGSLQPSSTGRLDQAKRFALSNFDKWNDVTGLVAPHSSYYYEICSVVEDGVEFGFGVAHAQSFKTIVRRIRGVKRE
jgi:hypothetical protein